VYPAATQRYDVTVIGKLLVVVAVLIDNDHWAAQLLRKGRHDKVDPKPRLYQGVGVMGPYPHNAPRAVISDENPMGTDGFEFVEYASTEPEKLHDLFQTMGFSAVAKHR